MKERPRKEPQDTIEEGIKAIEWIKEDFNKKGIINHWVIDSLIKLESHIRQE